MTDRTSIETARGISGVEVSLGHALVVVSGLSEEAWGQRMLEALGALKDADHSIDFLKVSSSGFSFVVPESQASSARDALCAAGFDAVVKEGRAILIVRAPNIRDESGLVARIAQLVVRSGATIEQVGDMHSSVQVVVEAAKVERAASVLRDCIGMVEIL
ncbi:MAG: hypothetical protein D6724_02180 [Armatimonadetes bacterium]|nr:MAG: hypothetical protein D6724_02180 [Armatimonadota bacterium]GIV01306.1 MAG: hypothetical protein KatS3mg015_0136 [Fimbriimonadales bacterium]